MFINKNWRYFVFFVVYCAAIMARFWQPGDLYLVYFTDDFFYYYKVAENFSRLGLSTFDGVHLTNGYHPLWMLVMAAVYRLVGGGELFFVATSLVICTLVSMTFVLYEKIVSHIFGRSAVTWAASLLMAIFLGVLARTGMEISLAAFFVALFFYRCVRQPVSSQSAGGLVLTGFIASLVFLSRIDAIIPVFIYFLLIASRMGSMKPVLRMAGYISLGAILVPLYVLVNWVGFDTLLPISGMAKQLKGTFAPSLMPLMRFSDVDKLNFLFVWPAALLAVFAGMSLSRSSLEQGSKSIVVALLLHPVVFYAILCFKSDWPSWTWYLYPIPPLLCVSIPLLNQVYKFKYRIDFVLATAVVALASIGVMGLVKVNNGALPIYYAAKAIGEFSKSHQGVYAMGDRAGMVAYFINDPLFQLEGLVGDKKLLDNIKQSRALVDVLQEMNVDYYVHSSEKVWRDPCFHFREPKQAGPASPVMSASLCYPPVAQYNFNGVETFIFKVSTGSQHPEGRSPHI